MSRSTALIKAETHDATNRGDKSPRLHRCCDKSLALSLSLRYVAQIQTSLNLCDRSLRQNSVAATMIFTCHTRRFVAATCRGDVSQRFVASCVSALKASKAVSLCWGCLQVLLMWKGLRSISVGKSWKYSGFICRGVGKNVSPLVSIVAGSRHVKEWHC